MKAWRWELVIGLGVCSGGRMARAYRYDQFWGMRVRDLSPRFLARATGREVVLFIEKGKMERDDRFEEGKLAAFGQVKLEPPSGTSMWT